MRTRPTPDPAGLPTPPPELAERCQVEDWLDPATFRPRWVEDDGPDGLYWAFISEARRRWRQARARWLDAHHVAPEQACDLIPLRAPAAGDEQAVRAAIARRLSRSRGARR